ncbi:transposase family protein [Streptomyces sp. NPDC006197]|uniref:transposase family protein n=1 Tax=Streptomyces sp. NPDC006197 TaxID=3156685 RepID=UPI0033A5652C
MRWTDLRNDEAPGRRVLDHDRPQPPGASRACLLVVDRPVQSHPAVSDGTTRCPGRGDPARTHGIVEALAAAELKCWAGKAYQGAGRPVPVPFRCRRLKRWQRRHSSTHAKIRCLGEQTMTTLKGWRLLWKLRCSANRITAIVQAVLVLHRASA